MLTPGPVQIAGPPEKLLFVSGISFAITPVMKNTKRAGFSLIEILVAMAVGLMMITGTAELLILAARSATRTEIRSAAADVLAARLELLKALPSSHPERTPGKHESLETSIRGCGDFVVEWVVDRISPECTAIVVEVAAASDPVIRIRAPLHILEDLGFEP